MSRHSKIPEYLKQHGPQTPKEIAKGLDRSIEGVRVSLCDLLKRGIIMRIRLGPRDVEYFVS